MVLYHGSTYDFMEIDLSKARKEKTLVWDII